MNPRQTFVIQAIIGGCGGALAMDVAQFAWARALERERPLDVQDEETEAISSVVRYLTRFAPRVFRPANAAQLGHGVHYIFGIAFAAAYLRFVPRRQPSPLRALTFGTLLWLLSDRILIPTFKLGRPWSRYSVTERSNALVSHLAYAFVVEYARQTA